MRTQIGRIAIAFAAALTLSACIDDNQDIFAPATDSAATAKDFTIIIPTLPNPEDFMDITAGEYHTCARKYNGNVYCWGTEGGPLGLTTATMVPTLKYSGAVMIDAGNYHTCMLNNARNAFCWGAGDKGQLGIGNGVYNTFSSAWVSAPINGATGSPLVFNTLSAGGNSTCGTAASGTYCWGEAGDPSQPNQGQGAPWRLGTYNGFTQLTVGNKHFCGRVSSSELYCWGYNNFGQAGVDPAWSYFYPNTQMLIFAHNSSLAGASRVVTQNDFTCSEQNGAIRCVGNNQNGQLGNGNTSTGQTWQPQTAVSSQQLTRVTTGTSHACALDQNNAAWCWGLNEYGQLGRGLTATKFGQLIAMTSTRPVAVLGGLTFRAIAAGRNHTCAIGTDNHIYCWGQNNYRQLGTYIFNNGQVVTNGFAPVPVTTL